jgi:hypothetical protein
MKSTALAIIIAVFVYIVFPALSTGIIIGLLVGWNLLEQPAFIRKYWDIAVAKFNELRN